MHDSIQRRPDLARNISAGLTLARLYRPLPPALNPRARTRRRRYLFTAWKYSTANATCAEDVT